MRRIPLLSLVLACSAAACSSGNETSDLGSPSGNDATPPGDAQIDRDAGGASDAPPPADGNVEPDTGPGPMDARTPDAMSMDAERMDGRPQPDSGMMLNPAIMPGQYVQLSNARVNVTTDTFADVRGRLGPGMRTATMGARSFEWTIGGAHLTVWFANTRLSNDPPPNDIHDADKVLWVSVDGTFSGRTPNNLGLGSTRAMVEATGMAGYGPAPHTVPLMTGVVAQYYKTGFLVTYDQAGAGGTVQTFTVCRAYPHAPDATLIPRTARISFMDGREILGSILMAPFQVGTSESSTRQTLGAPDGEGMVSLGGTNLRVLSYAFIGIEVFLPQGMNNVLFSSVHPPYYGTLNGTGNAGLGSTRQQVERSLNLGTGTASAGTPGLICYRGMNGRDVGVTYTADNPPVATTITIPLLACP